MSAFDEATEAALRELRAQGSTPVTPYGALRRDREKVVLTALRGSAEPLDLRALGAATGLDHTTLGIVLRNLVESGRARRSEKAGRFSAFPKSLKYQWQAA